MIKAIVTLFSARPRSAAEQCDARALALLDREIRDCANALARAKKAAAHAVAQNRAEKRRLETLNRQIAQLEARACEALRRDRDDIALETAGLLADLEADRDAIRRARALQQGEVETLRARLRQSQARLAELQRARDFTRAQAPGDARDETAGCAATLARLGQSARSADAPEAAQVGGEDARALKKMAAKLAQAGGRRATSEDVFERLRAKTRAA